MEMGFVCRRGRSRKRETEVQGSSVSCRDVVVPVHRRKVAQLLPVHG